MKRLIKADLAGILQLVPAYWPVSEESVRYEIDRLNSGALTDYLFLARREKCWLFDFPSVYTQDSYANLTWTYGKLLSYVPAIALSIHVDGAMDGRLRGSVAVLDYPASIQDVEIFASLPERQKYRHIQRLICQCLHRSQCCSMLEFIQILKETGGGHRDGCER